MEIKNGKLVDRKGVYIGKDGVGRMALPTIFTKAIGINEPGNHEVTVVCDLEKKELTISNGNGRGVASG